MGILPAGETDDGKRPFIEKRRYLASYQRARAARSAAVNLYAFVGMRPNELTDPLGLFGWRDVTDFAKDFVSEVAMSFGADRRTADNIGNFTISAAETFVKAAVVIGAVGVVIGVCRPCGLALGTAIVTKGVIQATENRLGQGQNLLQSVAGAAADFTGISDIYAGVKDKDIITGEKLGLTDYERAGRAGSGFGTAAGFLAAGKTLKAGERLGEVGRGAITDVASNLRARFEAARDSSGQWPSIKPEEGWGSKGAEPFPEVGKVNSAGQPINSKGQFLSEAGGESENAAAGRAAHTRFDQLVAGKPGWQFRPRLSDPSGKVHIPDALDPHGRPVELKPATESGYKRGRRAIKRYNWVTGKRGRVIYYDSVTGDLLPFWHPRR